MTKVLRVRHDLAWLTLIVLGAWAVYGTVAGASHKRPNRVGQRPRTMVCYLQTVEPTSVVCPDGQAYWHPMGQASPVPGVPKR